MSVTLALPSKGRLKEKTLSLLKEAGYEIQLPVDQRNYRARINNAPDIDVLFLSASEIARKLGSGAIDLGITGEDLLCETLARPEECIEIRLPLGFGHADVVVAVPDIWYDVSSMADLDDIAADFRQRHGRRLRVATRYWHLTQKFFSQKHGIQVYRIVESSGATEGAPAAGSADMIVDITSTGATLAASGLRVLDDGIILKSQACLVTSCLSSAHQEIERICAHISEVLHS